MARIRWPRRRGAPERLFDEQLLPVTRRLEQVGRRYFETAPDASVDSYWHVRDRVRMERADFEASAPRSPAELEAALRELWSADPELLPLAAGLQALAEKLHRVDVDDPDVSAFVYVMY